MSFTEALFTLLPLQALVAALVLVTLMGVRSDQRGGRWAQAGLLALALGLALVSPVVTARWGAQRGLQAAGVLALSTGLAAVWCALGQWLRQRRGRRLMLTAPVLLGAGYALLWPHRETAQTWADLGLAAQLAWLGAALTQPGRASVLQGLATRRWRLLGLAAVLPLGVALLARAAVTQFGSPSPTPDLLLALAGQLALLLTLPMLLLAWRGQTEAELAHLAQTDGLTGLIDRPAFFKRSVDLISMARRYGEPLALVVVELDHFDRLQSEHDLDLADRALALFGSCVQTQMRLGDLAGRLGTQRFGVLMARCQPEGPQALDLRLRTALAERAPAELGLTLSFSAGWAKLRPGDRNITDLQQRAETALYEAVRAGRGQLQAEPGLAD